MGAMQRRAKYLLLQAINFKVLNVLACCMIAEVPSSGAPTRLPAQHKHGGAQSESRRPAAAPAEQLSVPIQIRGHKRANQILKKFSRGPGLTGEKT